MLLKLNQIRTDGGTQPRAVLSDETIKEYAEAMRAGAQFPPVTVFHDGKHLWLADGFHRVGAARMVNAEGVIEAGVRQGTRRDAQWYSFGANKAHGLRRAPGDPRRSIETILADAEWGLVPQTDIAAHVGVSPAYVSQVKASIKQLIDKPAARTVTRGGTAYRQNTAKIGKSPGTSAKRRRKWGGVSPHAFKPVRGYSKPFPMTAMNVPHDPKAAARGLVALFDKPFLTALVEELTQILKGESQ